MLWTFPKEEPKNKEESGSRMEILQTHQRLVYTSKPVWIMQGVSQKHKNYSYLKLFQSRSALFCISIIHI